MITGLAYVCIPVKNYDEGILWYRERLGLTLHSDQSFGPGYRWVTMGAPKNPETQIVLYEITAGEKDPRLTQAGRIAGWVFHSDDCRKDIEHLRSQGVTITLEPEDLPWGTQAGFDDLYGNSFLLVQPKA
ncbi:glyoxalase [Heliobacterium gestii]|uniref:Glyoxalase n=1 Tax=Heliomicrobium gestii TaxID=2699 RepID=A0A845LIW5_HELGE|nr:VOC family protein [Heliomicrobium gestii]MBM7868337.1 catechol 2,3-dioxygenase-like lactoylglutathione lyase family enzyme [Heliomicrobium gestii]MZP44509.1 glyoxalase [Heliomicrobium gestii]